MKVYISQPMAGLTKEQIKIDGHFPKQSCGAVNSVPLFTGARVRQTHGITSFL